MVKSSGFPTINFNSPYLFFRAVYNYQVCSTLTAFYPTIIPRTGPIGKLIARRIKHQPSGRAEHH